MTQIRDLGKAQGLRSLTEMWVDGQLHIKNPSFLGKELMVPIGENSYIKSVFIGSNGSANDMHFNGQPLATAVVLTISEKTRLNTEMLLLQV
jgi:hypothetical protein